jgi:Ca2+-binding EF-hand superfamily protein
MVPNCVPEETQIDEIHRMPTKFNSLDPLSSKALAKQKLMNLIKSGKAKGALIANQQRTLNAGDEIDQEDLESLHEVLGKDAGAGDWIKDFVHSDNPKFAGKSKKERIKMALGAYYNKARDKQQTEELVGGQKKLDKNKNGKLDSQDFKILRKESIDEEGNLMADKITFKEFMMMLEYEAKDGVYRHKGTYGGSYVDPEGADDADDKKPAQQPAVKRGRGRPAGSKSGARSTTGTSKLFK